MKGTYGNLEAALEKRDMMKLIPNPPEQNF